MLDRLRVEQGRFPPVPHFLYRERNLFRVWLSLSFIFSLSVCLSLSLSVNQGEFLSSKNICRRNSAISRPTIWLDFFHARDWRRIWRVCVGQGEETTKTKECMWAWPARTAKLYRSGTILAGCMHSYR